MFIELEDVGVEFDDELHEPDRVDATAPEHGQPLLFNTDCIVYVRPVHLKDGNVITEICYSRRDHSTNYWVRTSYGALKTLLKQTGKFVDANVTLVDTPEPYEGPKSEYDFSASNPFMGKKKE